MQHEFDLWASFFFFFLSWRGGEKKIQYYKHAEHKSIPRLQMRGKREDDRVMDKMKALLKKRWNQGCAGRGTESEMVVGRRLRNNRAMSGVLKHVCCI